MSLANLLRAAYRILHVLSFFTLAALALTALGYTLASTVGVAPWLTFTAHFGDIFLPHAGQMTQIGVTVLLAALFFFMPASGRILALENSHRDFSVKMEDIARAYHICHAADRRGVFTMSSEFDEVRERLGYLRDHPDLERLEPDVLELAAQMSQQARHLADVYSDQKVARARTFLQQRQEEVEAQQARIVEAMHSCTEIRKWAQQVELEESVVASQLGRLEEQLAAALPALGYRLERDDTVIPLADRPAAE